MGHRWPYTNFHELNQDWIIGTVKKMSETMTRITDYLANTYISVGYDANTETLAFFIPDSANYVEETQTIIINIPIYPEEKRKAPWQMYQN